jgi:hypothetical protein
MKIKIPINQKEDHMCNVNKTRSWAALICVAVIAMTSIPAQAVDYSSWLKNISAPGDPGALYVHNYVKVAVSGSYVHFAWEGRAKDGSAMSLFYTRSADGGITFDIPKIIATSPYSFGIAFDGHFNNLVADGEYVHIIYTVGWPSSLQYLRSTDSGATFAAPYTFASGWYSYTADMAAADGKLAIAWSIYATPANGDVRGLYCAYSSNNGATFTTTQMAYKIGQPPYSYEVLDAVRSGDYVYILTKTVDNPDLNYQSRVHLWASWDGGATFKTPVKVTVPAIDTFDYARQLQAWYQYTPNLVATGLTVNITWLNIDNQPAGDITWFASTLRTRRSTDGGVTLGDPVTLHTMPSGYVGSLVFPGIETIAGSGNNLYITSTLGDAPAGTYIWRSTDAGATWGPAQQISGGGFGPITKVDPTDASKIHTVHSWYFLSKDYGANFDGGVNPHTTAVYNWDSPQMAVDATGVVHYVAVSGGAYTNEVFYRRIAAPPAPGATDKCLSLTSGVGGSTTRSDNMQVPATSDLQPASALTVEFWFKFNAFINSSYLQEIVLKNKLSGYSFHMGVWSDASPYCTLTTDTTTGAWAGTGLIVANDTWTHMAMTYDSSLASGNLKLYVNGVPSGAADVTGSILYDKMDYPIRIGRDDRNDNVTVNVDEVRIWNTAQSEADIIANMGTELAGTETGLVAYYNFNDTTKDITGNGNDGILMFQESYVEPGVKPPYIPPTTTTTIGGTTTSTISSTTTSTGGGSTTTTTPGGATTTTSVSSSSTTTSTGTETTTTTTAAGGCPAKKVLGADNPKLDNLRAFRDSRLAQSAIGRKIIQIYYTNAGSINASLERSPALRAVARRVLEVIAPLVGKN